MWYQSILSLKLKDLILNVVERMFFKDWIVRLKSVKKYVKSCYFYCNDNLYDLSHSSNNIKASNGDFKMLTECILAYKSPKSNPNIVVLKAKKKKYVVCNT